MQKEIYEKGPKFRGENVTVLQSKLFLHVFYVGKTTKDNFINFFFFYQKASSIEIVLCGQTVWVKRNY